MSSEAIRLAKTAVPVAPTEPSAAQASNREAARAHKAEASHDAVATQEEVRRSAEKVKEAISQLNRGIRFEIDESTHTIITKIVDKNTNEVIRQIPPQEVVKIAQRLKQSSGVFVNLKA
jgi:flagellar protein FlaG